MERGETAPAAAEAATVARELDSSLSYNASVKANANVRTVPILPEHPQAQLQFKLMALVQSQDLHERSMDGSPQLMVAQTKLPSRRMAAPSKLPAQEHPQVAGIVEFPLMAPRLAHHAKPVSKPKSTLQPLLKTESRRSREWCNGEQKDGSPKKQKKCSCKNSRCLKLYCDCFAAGVYCERCNCINCHNKVEHEADRNESIDAILERDSNAFRPKKSNSSHGVTDSGVGHRKGCSCNKSGCLKRYCECFHANIFCSNKCKCIDCKNFEGSEEMKALYPGYQANLLTSIQRVNAAINGAVGIPPCWKKSHQIVAEESLLKSHSQYYRTSARLPIPSASTALGPSKSPCRAHLAHILQLHVKDFCTLLVEVSAEAAKSLSEERKMINNTTDLNVAETLVASSHEDSEDNLNQHDAGKSYGNQENGPRTSLSESGDSTTQNGRTLSPETLALMCDEQDTMFITADKQPTDTECNTRTTNSSSTQSLMPLYVEQEKLVLMRLHGFLNRLIAFGFNGGDPMSSYSLNFSPIIGNNNLCNKASTD